MRRAGTAARTQSNAAAIIGRDCRDSRTGRAAVRSERRLIAASHDPLKLHSDGIEPAAGEPETPAIAASRRFAETRKERIFARQPLANE